MAGKNHVSEMFNDIDKACREGKSDLLPLYNIVADYFDDENRLPEAEAMRYMVLEKKRPYTIAMEEEKTKEDKPLKATWFNAGTIGTGLGDEESDLPSPLFNLLQGGKDVANHRTYNNVQEACEAFIAAYIRWDKVTTK